MRLSTMHKRLWHFSSALLWGSGTFWLVFHYFMRQPGDFGNLSHPLEIWWLRLHGLAMFLTLILLGTLVTSHGPVAWRVKRQRGSGMVMGGVFVWLVGTGYALYYFAGEREESWVPLLHWGAGLAAPLLLGLHLLHSVRRKTTHETL